MTNLHPLFVHFPIALLTFYALFELARFRKLQQAAYWFYVKACFVIAGSLSSIATYLSGDAIESLFRGDPKLEQLVETHSNFALASCLIFGLLALAYLIQWIGRDGQTQWPKLKDSKLFQRLYAASTSLLQSMLAPLLAVLGLVLITITGALGGSIVYGPNVDPFVKFIYGVLIGS